MTADNQQASLDEDNLIDNILDTSGNQKDEEFLEKKNETKDKESISLENESKTEVRAEFKTDESQENFETLIADKQYTQLPKVGDIIEGKISGIAKSEVKVDIGGIFSGVARGRELFDESDEYSNLKVGDEVAATVMELENENGDLELSFRHAGHQKAWDNLIELQKKGEPVKVKITEANKGGLIGKIGHIPGFLPVSQLASEHYPRVSGGDKGKILEKLRQFINKEMMVKIIDVHEQDEKLIFSEKEAWSEVQKGAISDLKVGDVVEGKVTAVTDFGIFVEFGDHLEGLVHISEIAWQRIDDPREFVKINDKVKAEIISIDGSKIFFSMKKLKDNPWKNVGDKYKIGEKVKGRVLKISPYGIFVQLDENIHGLAHISELADGPVENPETVAKVGEELEFRIVSIEPDNYRLGLSLKKPRAKDKTEDMTKDKVEDKKDELTTKEDEPVDEDEKKEREEKDEDKNKE